MVTVPKVGGAAPRASPAGSVIGCEAVIAATQGRATQVETHWQPGRIAALEDRSEVPRVRDL